MQEDIMFRERLEGKFKPTDFVRVINIDNEVFKWNYCPTEDVRQDRSSRVVLSRRVDEYELQPGESQVIEGGCAYVMVEKLFKSVVPKHNKGKFAMILDSTTQEDYIDKIVVGVENPFAQPTRAAVSVAAPEQERKPGVQVDPAQEVQTIEKEFADAKPATEPAAKVASPAPTTSGTAKA